MNSEPCKVLVIDDNRDAADSAVMLLRIWGHDGIAAYSAAEALEIGRRFEPDVVLIDIGLPGKSGFDVAQDLKRCCPNARFVALTGFTRADVARRARDEGFADHLVKPAELPVLKHVVEDQCAAGEHRSN